ncbi:MAG: uroporphyrinogen decarboxylase family protein [Clostridia bacterium]
MSIQLTAKERFFLCLNNKEIDRLPVINPTSIATQESCNSLGIKFNEVHLNADKTAALAAVGYERLGFDSVMPYFGVLMEAAAFGGDINWGSEGTFPTQRGSIYNNPDEFKMPDNFLELPPIKTIIDSIKSLRKQLGKDALIIGKVMGPWTLSYHLDGLEDFIVETITEPEMVHEFLAKFKEISIRFANAQFEAGADVVTLADHATADLISPSSYQEFLLPVHKEINQKFKDRPLILHCCGNTTDRISMFAEAGFPLFHFDSKNNIDLALKSASDMKLTGCVNNPDVLLRGTTETVNEQVKEIMQVSLKTPDRNAVITFSISCFPTNLSILLTSLLFINHLLFCKLFVPTSILLTQSCQIQKTSILLTHEAQKTQNIYPVNSRTYVIYPVNSRSKCPNLTCSLEVIIAQFCRLENFLKNLGTPIYQAILRPLLIHP